MTIQTINLGTAPSGAGGDTFRSTGTKVNENFTNNTHAASRLVGTAAGNVMEVGAFGLRDTLQGLGNIATTSQANNPNISNGFYEANDIIGAFVSLKSAYGSLLIGGSPYSGGAPTYVYFNSTLGSKVLTESSVQTFYTTQNTTVDSNGFIKKASPVIQLFADKISANQEAFEQNPIFEKVGVGHYLIKNTEGFSDNGWYIEMPKDANGNVLVAVQYQQLEDNTIEVKTFAKKFDEETGDIVPNIEKPRDIPAGRWIDIRLKALPQPEIEISNTPADFQPTNLAQAVSEALKDDAEQ